MLIFRICERQWLRALASVSDVSILCIVLLAFTFIVVCSLDFIFGKVAQKSGTDELRRTNRIARTEL